MANQEKKPTAELQIQIPPHVQHGVYANQMIVTHSKEEFILDFVLATPPVGVVSARVIVSPAHAKRILQALADNIARYEATFGTIDANLPSPPPMRH